MSENAHEIKEMAKIMKQIIGLDIFCLQKWLFSILQNQSGQNELISKI